MFDSLQPLSESIQNINWAVPTWDLFIVLVIGIAVLVYGFTLGRDKIMALMVSIYISLALTSYSPLLEVATKAGINIFNVFVVRLVLFWGLFILLSILFSKSILNEALEKRGPWWHLFLFNLLHVGLLMSITLSFFPVESLNSLSIVTKQVFISDVAVAFWLLAPIVFLGILRSRES